MPEHSYRCDCGNRLRRQFSLDEYPYPNEIPCSCGGRLTRFFERAPGMTPDIWSPYYDHQLGAVVTSRAQREQVAREKGFEIMGKEEFDRNRKMHSPKEDMPWDGEKFRDAAEKAYNDLKYGNVEVPKPATVDMATDPVVES